MSAILLMALGIPVAAWSGNVEVEIQVKEVTARTTAAPPTETAIPAPPSVSLEANQRFQAKWVAENTDPKTLFQNVLVHFLIVKEGPDGVAGTQKLGANAIYEGAVTMDFDPGETASWRFTTSLPEAGSYLFRVETLGLKLDSQTQSPYHTDMILTVK